MNKSSLKLNYQLPIYISIATCRIKVNFSKNQDKKEILKIKKGLSGFSVKSKKYDFQILYTDNKKGFTKNIYFIQPDKAVAHIAHVLKVIIRRFISEKGFFLHCSANLINEKEAIVFIGHSHAGKSTISRFLDKSFPKIIDETGLVLFKNRKIYIYQSAYREKGNPEKSPRGFRIKAVITLKQNYKLSLDRIGPDTENVKKIFRQLWIDREKIKQQFKFAVYFCRNIPFYQLSFPYNEEKAVKYFRNKLGRLKRG